MYCVESINRNGNPLNFLHISADSAKAPMVLLLHGFPDSAYGWNLQIDALKGKFQIIVPFLTKTKNTELKQDLKALVEKIRTGADQKIFVVSHDIGSFLSVDLLQEGLDIAGLIHINGLGMDQFVSRKFSLKQWLRSSYVFPAQIGLVRGLVRKFFPKAFLNFIYDLSRVHPDDDMRRFNDSSVLDHMAIYKDLLRTYISRLGKKKIFIKTPTLFIWGKDDVFLNLPSLAEVNRYYGAATVRILSGGHWVLRSQSPHVNKLIFQTLHSWGGPRE